MKVLVLTTTFPRWKDDSIPGFVFDLSKELQQKGLEIFVLTPHSPGAKEFEILDGITVFRFPYFFPKRFQRLVDGRGILPNIEHSLLAKLQLPFLFVFELVFAVKIIRQKKIDVVHSHWLVPNGLVGALCSRWCGVRHIVTEHAAGLAGIRKLPCYRIFLHYIVRNSSEIIVVSSHLRELLTTEIRAGRGNVILPEIAVIPMGVHTGSCNRDLNPQDLRDRYNITSKYLLLFIGRLAEKKGLRYLIEAMPEILKNAPDTELIIGGEGQTGEHCRKSAENLNCSGQVKFLGHISETEKFDYLSMADILVVPSIVMESGDTEGLPVVILEGLACGKPIIASDVGGIKDAIRDGYNGFLIEQKRPELISPRVLALLESDETRETFSKNARDSSQPFDWARIANQYYSRIIRK